MLKFEHNTELLVGLEVQWNSTYTDDVETTMEQFKSGIHINGPFMGNCNVMPNHFIAAPVVPWTPPIHHASSAA